MNLEEFVKKVLIDVNAAVDSAGRESSRRLYFSSAQNGTIEFDIAVSAEQSQAKGGKAGVKVLTFLEAGGEYSGESKNSTVSRIKFGINIHPDTKDEEAMRDNEASSYDGPDALFNLHDRY